MASRKRKISSADAPVPLVETEVFDHVVIAFDKSGNGSLGCACYDAKEELLLCMEDMEKADWDVIESLILDLQPTTVISPPRLDQVARVDNTQSLPYEIVLRPTSDFKFDNALKKLIPIHRDLFALNAMRFVVPDDLTEGMPITEPRDTTGDLLKLSSCLSLDNRISIGCAGAVITHLQKRRAAEYLPGDQQSSQAYRISRIESFTLKDTMLLNIDTLASLQILQPEVHTALTKQSSENSGAKESLSLFGLFYHFAKTSQGRLRLRQMFLRPSLDINTIVTRHDFITVCLKEENLSTAKRLSKSLGRVQNMIPVMTNLRKGVDCPKGKIKAGSWFAILEFCYQVLDIAAGLIELNHPHLPLCRLGIDVLDQPQLRAIGKTINDVVDLEESIEHNRTVIKRGINRNLDVVKDRFNSMEELLSQVARDIAAAMPMYVNVSVNVIFLPQLGFHVAIPVEPQTGCPIYSEDGWDERFRINSTVYMKNAKMREMDSDLGDLSAIICDTEIEISHDLAQRILEYQQMLVTASDFCGQLDCLLALVHGAVQYKLVRPRLVQDNIIKIKGGRHILQETTVPIFVPNDAFLVGGDMEGPTMIMMTGPNYSGKTVYQKQIALICYMSQIGSFVPATSATVGIVDKILTRVNTRESVSRLQSAFMIDLQQISRALKSCTNRSLIVIDEFGKGTDTCDGPALASAVFQHLLSLESDSPKVLANTHFHEIFEDSFQSDRILFANMEIMVSKTTDCEIVYLYNLKHGRSSLSYGIQCAQMSGMPAVVIKRAKRLTDVMNRGENLIEACSALPPAELEELEEAEDIARKFLAMDLDLPSTVDDVKAMISRYET